MRFGQGLARRCGSAGHSVLYRQFFGRNHCRRVRRDLWTAKRFLFRMPALPRLSQPSALSLNNFAPGTRIHPDHDSQVFHRGLKATVPLVNKRPTKTPMAMTAIRFKLFNPFLDLVVGAGLDDGGCRVGKRGSRPSAHGMAGSQFFGGSSGESFSLFRSSNFLFSSSHSLSLSSRCLSHSHFLDADRAWKIALPRDHLHSFSSRSLRRMWRLYFLDSGSM